MVSCSDSGLWCKMTCRWLWGCRRLSWTSREALLQNSRLFFLCCEPDDDEALLSGRAHWIRVETLRIHGRLIKAAPACRWDSSLTFISTPGSFFVLACHFTMLLSKKSHHYLSQEPFWFVLTREWWQRVAIIHSVFIFNSSNLTRMSVARCDSFGYSDRATITVDLR